MTVAASASSSVEAQQPPSASNELRVSRRVFDNFTQASDGEERLNIAATEIENLMTLPFRRGSWWTGYVRTELALYERFGTSPSAGIGVRRDGRHHIFDASVLGEWKRPVVDIGDTFGESNALSTAVQYGYRPTRRLALTATTSYRRDVFDRDALDASTYDVGGWIRYQVAGRAFMPSVGFATGRRDSSSASEDLSQNDVFFRVQSEFSGVRLNGRYRHRMRDYTIADPRSRNFGREDVRRQFSFSAEIPMHRDIAAVGSYITERNRSSRANRNFTTHTVTFGLAWRMRWMEPPQSSEVR